MGGRRGWVSLALALVGAVGLTGCTGGDDPPPTVTSSLSPSEGTTGTAGSTTTSATTSATVAPVDLPAEATKHTEAGAKAFAKYFWETASASLVTNDAAPVTAMSAPECGECGAFADIAGKQAANKHHSEKSSYKIRIVRTASRSADRYVISVAGDEVRVRTLDEDGDVVDTSKPGVFSWATSLVWDDRWLVTGFKGE